MSSPNSHIASQLLHQNGQMRRKDCCCSLSVNARKKKIGLGLKMQAFGMEQAITSPKILSIVNQVSDIVNNSIATLIPYFCFNYTIGEAYKKSRRKLKPLGTPMLLGPIYFHCLVSVIVLHKRLMSLLQLLPPAQVKSVLTFVICFRS